MSFSLYKPVEHSRTQISSSDPVGGLVDLNGFNRSVIAEQRVNVLPMDYLKVLPHLGEFDS